MYQIVLDDSFRLVLGPENGPDRSQLMNCKTITVSVVIIWLFLTSSFHSSCVWMLLSFRLICCNSCTWKMVLPEKKKNLYLFYFWFILATTFENFFFFFLLLIWPFIYETFFCKNFVKIKLKVKSCNWIWSSSWIWVKWKPFNVITAYVFILLIMIS